MNDLGPFTSGKMIFEYFSFDSDYLLTCPIVCVQPEPVPSVEILLIIITDVFENKVSILRGECVEKDAPAIWSDVIKCTPPRQSHKDTVFCRHKVHRVVYSGNSAQWT